MTRKIELTERQTAYLIRHFKHTKNPELAEKLGISETALHRFARLYGLKKTPQHMRKMQRNTAEKAKESHLKNGTYPPKGYRIPRSEEFQFRPGEKPVDRLGEKRNKERIAKSAASRAATYHDELLRSKWGLEQRTKMRVIATPRQLIADRHYLKVRGYIIDEAKKVAYYTPETHRATRLEAKPKRFYEFKEYKSVVSKSI